MPGPTSFARFLSALSLALLPAILFPQPALADEGLRADKTEIAVGESTTVRLEGVSGLFKTRWHNAPEGIIRFDNKSNKEAGVTALKPGRVSITAKVLTNSYSLEIKVLDAPEKKDPKGGWHTKIEGIAKGLGFPDKDARIVRMLAEVQDGSRLPYEFYADLAKIPANMFDVINVRSKLVDGHPDFARDVLGKTFAAGGTPVEMDLLAWRRNQTLAAIDAVIKRFVDAGRVPKNGASLIVSHVGKWATQALSALTFTGDIDFSFVSSTDVELAEAMKAAFADEIKRRTGLDPKSLDSVATAHGRAGLEVYIGRHGMAFAEEQLKINQLVDMSTGQKTEIELPEVTKTLATERSLAESAGKQPPKPVHDTEPGLSMEMVRHFGHDIVKPKIFDLTNAVVKAAKYLDRSYKSLEKAKGSPDDPKLADFAKQMTEWANARPQTAEIRDNMIKRISEYLGSEPRVVFDGDTQKLALALDPGQIAAFHEKATDAMWKTVEQGSTARTQEMETRMRDLTERKRRGEIGKDGVDEEVAKLRADMTSLIDMVEAEVKAFKDVAVPKVVIDNNAKVRALMNILAGRFGTKVLSEEELKDKKFVEELLKAEGQHGSEMRRQMTAAYIMERSVDALIRSPEFAMSGVEKTNQMLDFIDDRLLGSIRGETGFSDFETELKLIRQTALDPKTRPGVMKELNALKSHVALGIKTVNQKINQNLQSTSAGRQGMKFMMVYGLADEMKSYRDAFNNDGWGGFATEIFRRRIPLGSAVEGAVMGNTYRAGWDVVTTLIPPLALPEAAWGLGTAIGTQAQSTYWSEQLSLFVDTLYATAKFKLVEVETRGATKVGVYRLESVKHRGITIDLAQFADMRKEQVDALRQKVGKGHIDWAAYDKEFQGLTRWTEVDKLLQKNIAASDPVLALLEEMANHPNVGPKLMDRLAEKGIARWEEVKLGFITNLIKRLEDRKQADQALGAGMLPELFAQLRKAAADLEIEEAVLRSLDTEVDTNNLKALMNWLWDSKRSALGQAPTESETTRAAQVVKKYLDTYQSIVKSRDQLQTSLPAVAAKDGSTRYLTSDLFLSGRAEADKAAADVWVKHVGGSLTAGSDALLAIKKEFLPNLALDAEDEKYLVRVFPRELWMKPYKDAGIARQKTWLLDRAIAHGKERNAILDEYKAWLEKQAPVQLSVTVLDALDGKKQIGGAAGDLRPTDILGKPGSGKASGNQLLFGVPSGRYRLTIKASGYDDASQDVLLGRALNPKPTLTVSLMPSDKRGDSDLAQFIADALHARDWKRLADRLDLEKKSDLKMQNVVAWQANIDALGVALKTLKDERIDWALAWRPYIDALDNIDSSVWDKLTRQVEIKRTEVERRCWDSSGSTLDSKKRTERCQSEGRKFEESCVGTWPAQHWEEMKRIRIAKQELPDATHTLHSAGYGGYRAWFEAVEKLTEKYKLPFPYPKPVTPRLKYALGCADVALPTSKKDADSAIKVTVEAPSASLPFGKSVTLNANASGGKAPYSLAWSSGGSGQRVSVTPRWAGEWTVTVTASDADGKSGEGSATVRVTAAQVKLQGTQPTVFYGSTATLSLPGKEPPPPPVAGPDPCAGRGYTSHNPFDECTRVTNVKVVPTAPRDPRWEAVGVTPPPIVEEMDIQAQPAAKPATGKQRVVWQAEPAVTLNPPTSNDGKTRVTYDRMGSVKLWCEIQEEIEGAFHSVGECGQETVKVIAPKFSVAFTPPEGQGRIGQEIRAQVNSQPAVADKLIDFRWFDPPTSNRMELSTNAREISFKLKDAKPLVLKALARVPYHGDEIAEISATYTGQVYQVKAWAVEPGTRPMMWDAKKGGLVPVPKGSYATHERISLRAEIQGGAPAGVRWNWTVNDDTTISNPISQTPTVSRSSAGGINARVEARDGENALLGSGDVSLSVIEVRDTPPAPANPTPTLTPDKTTLERGESVSISAEVNGGKPPYTYAWQGATGQGARVTAKPGKIGQHTVRLTVTDSKGKSGTASVTLEVTESQGDRNKNEATKLSDQARKQLQQGDLPAAANTVRAANKLDPAAARAASGEVAAAAKKAGWRNVHDRDFEKAIPNLEAAHELDPVDQDTANKLDQAKRFAQVWPQVETKAREFDAQMAEKKVWTAQKTMLEMQSLQHEMTGGMANPLSQRVTDAFNAGIAEYNRFMQEVNDRHTRAFKEQNWQTMLENAEAAMQREHNLAGEKDLRNKIDFAQQKLREQATKQATKEAAAKPSQPVDLGAVGGKRGTPRTVNNVSIDDASWVRFKSTDEKRLDLNIPVPTPTQAAAVAVVSNLDDATYLEQGKTIARITVFKDSGDETLDIQAGVHSSEWNYGVGPKHDRFNAGDIGDNRFLAVLPLRRPGIVTGLRINYVETNAPKWSGHAPGFCLRGVSLVQNTRGIALTPPISSPTQTASGPAANIVGKWKTSEGELTLNQSGNQINGTYSSDGGEIVGDMRGNVLEGYWIENGSSERCATAKNGRYHWGRIRWTFDDNKFAGVWSYCDKPLPASGVGWSGERIGGAPSTSTFIPEDDWGVVETTPGMYRLEQGNGQLKIARQGNNPGGLQNAGLRLNRGLPVSGDFDAQVNFSEARIEGGLNQIELHASFADGAIFYVVRDREGSGSHIWAPGLQGNQPCGRAATLRMERRGDTVTGYCDGKSIWSAKRPAALVGVKFVLQNNGSNDPISATFRDWRFKSAAATTPMANASGLAGPWSINANGYTGKLELSESGGRPSGHLSGRVWFDAHRVWEDLRDFSFDGRTLRFLRPGPSQRYTGTLSGNEVRGTFDQGGGGSWNWVITRSGTPLPPDSGGRDYTGYTPPPESSEPPPAVPGNGKLVLEDDKGPYSWIEGTEVQTQVVRSGRAAFRATGNNHFTHRLGIVGDYANQYRYLDFWIYLKHPSADIQIQVQVDGTWGKRWGLDGDATYNGYSWPMEGTTGGLASGRWLHQRIDLVQQLHISAGQAVTGLAFSSDGGDVYYDSVYLVPHGAPLPPPRGSLSGKRVLEDDLGPYSWIEKTSVQKEVVAHGQAAFKSTGNNHFTGELGIVGDYPEQFRSLSFWLFPIGPEADVQLQVQVDGVWGKRWGYDAGPKYNGYSWPMEGTTGGLKPGQWQEVTIDLLRDLHINPGQKITGMAFSSDGGDVFFDSVHLRPNPNPANKPAFRPAGKPVLEDNLASYNWIERSELQNYLVFNGAKSFRATGNNHFVADLGVAGSGGGQYRYLDFWAFFMGAEADVQVQVQVNGTWGKRWGFDAGPVYNGYSWPMEGTSTGISNGRWVPIRVDLLRQLHLNPGDRITGLGFSSDNADVIYDSVYLLPDGAAPVDGGYQGGDGGRDYSGYTPQPASGGAAKASGLAGTWSINANGYTGKLELSESGGRPSGHLSGRVWFDAHRVWEDLRDFSFDGRTLRFLRPGPSQRYTGTLSGNEVRGTFDQGGGGTWSWVITRSGAATLPEADKTGANNLARGKPASQSSRSQWSRPDDPQGAVDGVINGGYAFHTNNEANPWWQVDLGASYRLAEVRLYNRLDSSPERARTLQVMLSDDGRNWRTVYRHKGSVFGGKDGKPLVVVLSDVQARHVRLQLNESNWFHLDEVEVIGAGEATPSDGGRDYSGYTPQPTSNAPPAAAATLLEQVDVINDTWKGLKGLFGK